MKTNKNKRPAESVRDPDWTRAQLMAAAREEFAAKGFSGARVNNIAAEAGVNKQLLYYYYGDKEGLYVAVLEEAFGGLRRGETALDLSNLDPEAAIRRMIEFYYDYLVENRYFVALLIDENVHEARHVVNTTSFTQPGKHPKDTIREILDRGAETGEFLRTMEASEFYVVLAGFCYIHLAARHTLSSFLGEDIDTAERIAARRRITTDMMIAYLKTSEV